MTYRLVGDIDLRAGHYNPSQPRDSHGRWTSGGAVAVKAAAYMVNGQKFDAEGYALKAPAVQRGGGVTAFMGGTSTLKPMPKAKTADIEPGAHFGSVKAWYGKTDDTDKDNLSSDLGLKPEFRERSIKELRKAIKSRDTSAEERAAMKAELAKRVAIAKAANEAMPGFTNRLAKRLEDKPEEADLAPIIGETLAAHPKLGALAHIWDRLRLGGYNFRKKVREGEFVDELPRIAARTAGTVLMAFLLIHFGVSLPGLENLAGTAAGD